MCRRGAMSELKATRTVTVSNRQGLHLRTALLVVNLVRQFRAKVTLVTEERQRADAGEVLEIMSLGPTWGGKCSWRPSARKRKRWSRPWRSSSLTSFTKTICKAMQKLQGIAVSPGVAIGEALVMDNEGFRIPRRFVAREAAWTRNWSGWTGPSPPPARKSPSTATPSPPNWARNTAPSSRPTCRCSRSSQLRSELEEMIRQRHYSPEYAVSRSLRRYAQVFQRLEPSYLAERANDIFDIEKRLLRHLLGRRREGISQLNLAGAGAGPQPHAQRGGQSRPPLRSRFRHRDRRAGQPHGDRGRGPGNPGRGRHRPVPHRGLRRRPGDHRRRPRDW